MCSHTGAGIYRPVRSTSINEDLSRLFNIHEACLIQ